MFSAQAVASQADLDDVAARLVEPSAEATASWRDLASRWRSLPVGDLPAQLDPHLAAASHRVRGIIDQLLDAAGPGKAGPAYALDFRVDLPQACPMLRNALALLPDAARVTRDLVAAPISPIVGPALVLERQAAELPGHDIAWTDPGAITRGQLVPMPAPSGGTIAWAGMRRPRAPRIKAASSSANSCPSGASQGAPHRPLGPGEQGVDRTGITVVLGLWLRSRPPAEAGAGIGSRGMRPRGTATLLACGQGGQQSGQTRRTQPNDA